ncbi:O-antigen ligase family protein [Casimicrobium huifangae]|uniref:O-antigen ligase family protein n=1 Tax=Casimicrobium huifangae TaxID=2591109 RepID=UPI0012EC5CDE|nr:O-antigen ligase family protein [Casimicrobium huifangae]
MLHAVSPGLSKALAVLLGLFVCSVWYRGGNDDAIVAVGGFLASLVLGLLAVTAYRAGSLKIEVSAVLALVALLLIAVAGLLGQIRLPAALWTALPGRDSYKIVTDWLALAPSLGGDFALAIDPRRAAIATLTAIAAVAAFAVAHLLPAKLAEQFLRFLTFVAIVQAALGLLQFAFGSPSFMAFGTAVGGHRASGTFVNKNHFATLLGMLLPLLIFRSAGWLGTPSSMRGNGASLANGWWMFATAVVAAALVCSQSRAGVAAAAVSAMLATILCVYHSRSTRSRIALALSLGLAMLMAAGSGLGVLWRSIESPDFLSSMAGRHLMYRTTWEAAKELFPVGAGLGSYSIAFQRVQPPDITGYVEFAHNDYAQVLFELGAVGVIVIALLALSGLIAGKYLLARSCQRLSRPPLAAACALGCLSYAIHAWYDFPSHIPSVAWTACVLAGFATRRDL